MKTPRALAGLVGAVAVFMALSTAAQVKTGPGVAGGTITVGVLSVLTGQAIVVDGGVNRSI